MSTVSKLQIVLEATTTAFDRGLRKAQDGLNAFAKQTDKIHAKMESFQKRHQGAFDAMQAIGAASAVGLVAIGAGIKATTAEAMKFESAMAEVKKVVNFESPDGIKQMRAELEELSTRVPIAFDGLAKIAAAAGQSGIAANEIVKFTEAAAKMGTAFDITAEQAGQAMAEMRTAFKMSQAEVETLADKINYLGNNSPNAAAKIMEVVQRIGPLGEIAGVSADQIAAMAASLTSVEPDVAATGLKNMMLQLVKGESLSKSAKAAFDDLGLSYTEIAKGMQTDSIGTINKVFEAIKKLPEEAQAATINDIFGSESIAVISQLINGTDTLGKHLQAMGDASKYAGSMSQEAANINNTSAAKMEMFKNATQNAKAAIGDAFLPALGALAEALLPVINGIKQFAQENPTMVTAITGIVGGVLVLGTALGAIGLAVPLVTTALGGLTAIAGLVGAAIGAISLPVVAVVAAIAALVAAGVWLYNNWDMVKAKATEVWNAIPEYASQAWQWIQGVWSGVGAWFGGIWDSVVSSVNTAWVAIKQAFANWLAGMPAPVQEMVANIGSIFSGIATIASAAWAGITAVAKTVFSAVVAIWQGLSSAVSSAWQGIVGVASSVWNSVKSTVTSAINAIKPVISSIGAFFSAVWQGLVAVASSVWSAIKAAAMLGIEAIKASLTAGVTGFAIIFNAGFNAVKTVVSTVFNAIKALVRGDINGVKTAIQSGLSQLGGIARNAMSQMVSAITSIGGRLRQAGSEIVQGLINGISAKMEAAVAKIREMASRMKSAVTGFFDINSPSRVMKQIGEWVSEGLALGVAAKAPLAAKEAKKLAEATKKAFDDEIKSLDRSILVNKLKLQGDPNAEFTADVVSGKYGNPANKTALQPLFDKKQQELDLANQLKGLDEYNGKLADINRQIALVGNSSKVQEFLYDVEKGSNLTEKQVIGVVNALRQLEEAESRFKLDTEIQKSNDALERHLYLATQTADKYAAMRYDLAAQGFNQDQINHLVGNQQKTDVVNDFTNLQKNYTFETDAQRLKREYDEKLAIVTSYEQQIGDTIGAATAVKQALFEEHFAKVLDLEMKNYNERLGLQQQALGLASGVWDSMTDIVKKSFGEQSIAAKIMFVGQKALSMAQAVINTELAATKALAEGGMIMGIPMATAVRAAGYASVGLIAGQTISNLVGQAHDGIMSVPKSGTWNLEKGERVLPRHTAKALDAKLDSMGSGASHITINQHITVNADGTADVQQEQSNAMGQALKNGMLAVINGEIRQGGAIYNFVRNQR